MSVFSFGLGIAYLHYNQQIAILHYQLSRPQELPVAQPPPAQPQSEPAPAVAHVPIPASLNLDVPFTSQAPAGTWDNTHEEFCEEASVLMAARFFAQEPIISAADADQAMMSLKSWELVHLGKFESTTATETQQMIEANFPLHVTLKREPTIQDIKQALADGSLILVPSAGQKLHNPFFKQPGPIYHMLVVKGFTAKQFITNDPGTRHGADYLYGTDTLMQAMSDYSDNDPAHGTKIALVVSLS